MTTPTTAEPPVPICSCVEYWPGDGYAPDCPVLREILDARATIARLEGELNAEQRAHEEKSQRMTADLVVAKREVASLTEIARCETEFAMAARTRADAAERDAKRYRWLREQVGYWQNGSEQTVCLSVDDATRSEFIRVGKTTYGTDDSTIEGIIDAELSAAKDDHNDEGSTSLCCDVSEVDADEGDW